MRPFGATSGFFLRFDELERSGKVLALSTTRTNGCSKSPFDSLNLGLDTEDAVENVQANRLLLAGGLGIPGESLFSMKQVHGSGIKSVAKGKDAEELAECDARLTDESGVFMAVQTADCLAVIAVDEKKHVCGVAHAGWRGALQKIAIGLIERMKKDYNCSPKDIHAGLSPCIGPCHLELGEEQHRLFKKEFNEVGSFCTPLKGSHFKMDLWACVINQLESTGVPNENIEVKRLCTFCHPELFFSYRRDGKKTGRMLTIAGFL